MKTNINNIESGVKIAKMTLLAAAILALTLTVTAPSAWAQHDWQTMVAATSTNVHTDANRNSHVVRTLNRGESIKVTTPHEAERAEWCDARNETSEEPLGVVNCSALLSKEEAKEQIGWIERKPYEDIVVHLYMTDWCFSSYEARKYLKRLGVTVVEHDIEKDLSSISELKKVGARGVPLIRIDNSYIKGFSGKAKKVIRQVIDKKRIVS